MTNEEVERAIDFLLRSQANSEARIEQTNEQLNRLAGNVDQLTGNVDQLAGKVDELTEGVDQMRGQISSFAETQVELMRVMTTFIESQTRTNELMADRQGRVEEALLRLAEAETQSERRLEALTKIVEEERGRR